MDDLKWLQERIFGLSSENISKIGNEILSSPHISTEELVINLAHNIVLATQSQCLQLHIYVDLVIYLISNSDYNNDNNDLPILQLIPELISFCFKYSIINKDYQSFLVLNCFRYNQFYFLYLLFKRIQNEKSDKNNFFSFYDSHYFTNIIYDEYLKFSQYLPFEVLQMFLPEIEKTDKNLFFSLMKKKMNSQADLETIISIRDNFFCNSELLQSIQNDDVDKFQQLMIHKKLTDEIELWKFYPFRTTTSSYPLNMSAFFGSLKCFKFILLNEDESDLINDDLMRDAIFGKNVEIIRIVKQKTQNKMNKELVNYAIATHQNEIAQWIIDDNNELKLNSFIEACLYSNNLEMIDSIVFQLKDNEKSAIFNDMKNVLALENCASSGFNEIIQYLFETEFVNSWKNKQKIFMKILLKIAEKQSIEKVDFLYRNNIEEFNKYVMNYTELLIAAAKSGRNDMFNYAFKLFKQQKKRPKTNKKILGKAIIGGNCDIFKKCLKLFPHDLNVMYKDNFSLLSLSIIKNSKEIFDFLLTFVNQQEIDINQNYKGRTPLYYSLLYRRVEMTMILLSYPHVDVNLSFPIMIAIKFGFVDVVKKMCQFEQLDVNNTVTPDGTPLLLAIEKKDIEIFKALLSIKGIDINMSSSSFPTPIMKAIETCQNEPEFQDILFSYENIDLNIMDGSYYSNILYLAICSGNSRAIKELNKRNFKLPNEKIPFEINKESLEAVLQYQNFSPSVFKSGYIDYFTQHKYFDIIKLCQKYDDCEKSEQ